MIPSLRTVLEHCLLAAGTVPPPTRVFRGKHSPCSKGVLGPFQAFHAVWGCFPFRTRSLFSPEV